MRQHPRESTRSSCRSPTPARESTQEQLRGRLVRSRLTHAVSRLEQSGYVVRRNQPTDKRAQLAQLTEAGATLLAKAAPGHVTAVRQAVFNALTPEQVHQLAEIAEAITQSLHEPNPPWRRR